jgi:uncharacterized iron-regulated membrane protein
MTKRGGFWELLLVCHRWLALVVGLVLLVVAVSGALLVFEQPIANAAAMRVRPGGNPLPLDSLAARAVATAGGGTLVMASLGPAADAAWAFVVARDSSQSTLMMNPYTGQVLGAAPPPTRLERAIRNVHVFHTRLLAGNTGGAVVDFVTLATLLLVVTGIIIWFRDRRWKIQWSASWKRVVFDLHHTAGILAAIVLLVITGTGVWMGYPDQVDALVMRLNRTPPPAGQPRQPPPDSGARVVGLGALVAIAQREVPGAPVLVVRMSPVGPELVTLRYPEDHTPGGRSRVWIDRYRGTVLRTQNTRALEAGSKLLSLQRPLHTGDIAGVGGSVVWFLAALVVGSQAVTGVLMWWNGRAARAVKARDAVPTSV